VLPPGESHVEYAPRALIRLEKDGTDGRQTVTYAYVTMNSIPGTAADAEKR